MYPFGLDYEIVEQRHRDFIQAAQKAQQVKQLKAHRPGLGAVIIPIIAQGLIVAGQHLKGQQDVEMADYAG